MMLLRWGCIVEVRYAPWDAGDSFDPKRSVGEAFAGVEGRLVRFPLFCRNLFMRCAR